ncbi:aromatic acid/H+ symport family MFS transporter [Bradyrhizobium sp. 18BD]
MPTAQRLDIQSFFDNRPVGFFQWKVLIICLIVLILDGFDVVAMGFIAPSIVSDWHIAREALGPVLSAGLFGLAIGALAGGPLADRFGRKVVIISAILFFGLMSFASAYSPDLTTLTIFRFLTGLGLGASQPNAATLVAEYAPKRRRALFVTVVYCGFTLGAAAGGFLSAGLIQSFGWSSILIVGGVVPILFAVAFIPLMPESARFLALKHKHRSALVAIVNRIEPGTADLSTEFVIHEEAHAGKGAIKLILSSGFLLPTLTLWVGLFMNLLTVYLLNSWLPIMIKDAGFTLQEAALIGAMGQVGGTLGNIAIGWEMDRWNPHKVLIGTLFAAGVIALLIGSQTHSEPVLMVLIFAIGYCINSSNTGWTALAASFYPTEMRATGTSWMTGIGRFGAISGASVGAVILGAQGTFGQVFIFLTVPIAIGMIAAFLKGRARPGPATAVEAVAH